MPVDEAEASTRNVETPDDHDAPVELELKLAVAPARVEQLAQHPLLLAQATGARRTERMLARYFDTPDSVLARARIALRLRREGARWVQTLKTSSGAALALRSRGEWESAVAGPRLDWAALAKTPLAQRDDFQRLPKLVRCVFTVRVRRRSWALILPDGTRATASLDVGEIACGRGASRQVEPIIEFELEFEQGEPAALWKFASRIAAEMNLVPLSVSKAERGHALASRVKPVPMKSKVPAIGAAMDVHAALALAAGAPLAALQHNLRHLDVQEPEFVHQARVALRRLRSVLRAFAKLVHGRRLRRDIERLNAPLKSLGRLLGAARDADVFAIESLPAVEKAARKAGVATTDSGEHAGRAEPALDAPLIERATARRGAAHADVTAWLASSEHGDLLLAAERLVFDAQQRACAAAASPERSLDRLLGPRLARQHGKVQRAAEALTRLGPGDRHALRIEVKRLRYLLDIALPLWPEEASNDYREALEALQERLGGLNDIAVAKRQLGELDAADSLRAAWAAHERKRLDHELPRIAKKLAALDLAVVPWRGNR